MDPTVIAQVQTPGSATAVAIDGDRIAVADGISGVAIVDAGGANGSIVAQTGLPGSAQAVAADGALAYVGTTTGHIAVVDMGTGEVFSELNAGRSVQDIAVSGDALYVYTIGELLHIKSAVSASP